MIFLKSLPKIESVGIIDGNSNVWARFRDGEMLVVANNRPSDPAADADSGRRSALLFSTEPTGINLPTTTKIKMMSAMGTYFDSGNDKPHPLETIYGYAVIGPDESPLSTPDHRVTPS